MAKKVPAWLESGAGLEQEGTGLCALCAMASPEPLAWVPVGLGAPGCAGARQELGWA